jgi:citrate lyase subunit beta/citryl-CoA lyase
MMAKGAASIADEVFFDLEDACAPSEKESARALAVAALRAHDFGRKTRAVRVNGVTTPWCHRDIEEIVLGAHESLDGLMIPKVEEADEVVFVDRLLAALEREAGASRPIRLEILIESAAGAANLREIARASDRIDTLIFGPADYAASLGVTQSEIGQIDERYPGHQWHWVMSEIAVHARAIGAQAIDGPHADYVDGTSYETSAVRARLLGFDGKWCIHPNQIPWANEVFSPSPEEIQKARRIVDAYEEALSTGQGAIAVDGKLVDEASRRLAETTLARGMAVESLA